MRRSVIFGPLVVVAVGCAHLAAPPPTDPVAPGPPRGGGARPRTLACEVFLLRAAEGDDLRGDGLWQFVDEQVFPEPLRRRLASHGLRAGVVSDPPPECLAGRLAPATTEPAPPADPSRVHSVLRLLPGQESELVAVAGPRRLVILEHDDDGIGGGTYEDASAVVTLVAHPGADGRTRLVLTPTVKHGAIERSWEGTDGAFRLATGQRRRGFDGLRMEIELADHEALVVAGAGAPAATVGDAFFRDESGPTAVHRLLVIRPLARALDPRFAAAGTGSGDLESLRRR